jgi:hypothetical protein
LDLEYFKDKARARAKAKARAKTKVKAKVKVKVKGQRSMSRGQGQGQGHGFDTDSVHAKCEGVWSTTPLLYFLPTRCAYPIGWTDPSNIFDPLPNKSFLFD